MNLCASRSSCWIGACSGNSKARGSCGIAHRSCYVCSWSYATSRFPEVNNENVLQQYCAAGPMLELEKLPHCLAVLIVFTFEPSALEVQCVWFAKLFVSLNEGKKRFLSAIARGHPLPRRQLVLFNKWGWRRLELNSAHILTDTCGCFALQMALPNTHNFMNWLVNQL